MLSSLYIYVPLRLPPDCIFCLLFILAVEPPKRRREGQERREEREKWEKIEKEKAWKNGQIDNKKCVGQFCPGLQQCKGKGPAQYLV